MKLSKTETFYQTIDWNRVLQSISPEIVDYIRKSKDFLLQHISGDVLVLEAGCGNGDFIKEISKQVKRVVGVDYSEALLGQARENLKGTHNAKLIVGDIQKIKLLKNHFDYAISMWTLPNLDHPEEFLKTLKKTIKKDGTIFIDTYSENATPARINSYKKYGLTVLKVTQNEIQIKEGLTEKIHSKEKLKSIFKKAGLKLDIVELNPIAYMCVATK